MIELNPNNIESYREKIDFLKSIKKYDLVIECYDNMIKADPNNIESYREKIDFLNQLADKSDYSSDREKYYNLAIEWYDKAIELEPSSELYRGKYYALNRLNRTYEANECWRKAEELKELGL